MGKKIIVMGAGIAGHTAAMLLRKKLSKEHQVIVVSPAKNYQWIPSNIWVGVGRMKPEDGYFPLAPVYARKGIEFHQASAVALYPEGKSGSGAYVDKGGYITSTKVFTESILSEYGIRWIKRAGVFKVEEGKIHYETLDGGKHELGFDFTMLIPSFAGVGLKAYDRTGADITADVFLPNGLMKVDADYTAKPYENWSVKDWPSCYQTPRFENVFAAGIAFAPPHPISKPFESPNGTKIFPTPPRTGMPSGVIGKVIAENIVDSIKHGHISLEHRASMGKMGAACIVSSGFGLFKGLAATMTVYPIVPDYEKYPRWGRDIRYTVGEPGLAGHWLKHFMHYMFIYKAKGLPGWSLIPE